MKRRLYRMLEPNGQRAVMAIAILVALDVSRSQHGWDRTLFLSGAVLMILAQLQVERSRRRLRRVNWEAAARSPDPIAYLAQTEYMNGLTPRECTTVLVWQVEHGFRWTDEDVEAAPDVVRGWVLAGERAPREAR